MFSENIERLNTVLAEPASLSKQEELVKLNRQTTTQISELKKVMSEGSASIVTNCKVMAMSLESRLSRLVKF